MFVALGDRRLVNKKRLPFLTSSFSKRSIKFHELSHMSIDAEIIQREGLRSLAQIAAFCRIIQKSAKPFTQHAVISDPKNRGKFTVPGCLEERLDVRHDHRHTGEHGFRYRDRQAFLQRRKNKNIQCCQDIRDVASRPEKMHSFVYPVIDAEIHTISELCFRSFFDPSREQEMRIAELREHRRQSAAHC